jgi:choline dehydrogenase-like flavoprotein
MLFSGENLQDHTESTATWERTDNGVTFDSLRNNETFSQQQAALYASNSDDPASILDQTVPNIAYISLSSLVGSTTAETLGAEADAYVSTLQTPYKSTLEAQITLLREYPDAVSQMELVALDEAASPGLYSSDKTYMSLLAAQQHLLSRGSIHLQSSNAADHPIINPNYFSVPFDVTVATAGTAYLRKIAATSQYSAILGTEVYPGQGTDLQNYTISTVSTEFHPVGTASMLPQDQGGVVDTSLRVSVPQTFALSMHQLYHSIFPPTSKRLYMELQRRQPISFLRVYEIMNQLYPVLVFSP